MHSLSTAPYGKFFMSSQPPNPASNSKEPGSRVPTRLDETSGYDGIVRLEETFEMSGSTVSGASRITAGKSQRIVKGYRLGELLGQGGMGRVYRAVDSSGRSVALKLLSPDLACSPDALARFKQEGMIASQINHPHCVFVHRVDEDAGTPFIAMELMTGKTLKDIVVERGALPCAEAIPLILQCIDGLIAAHALGMIHRDIKPANCYLDESGNVKIGDFGLARSLVSDAELTQTGAFLGTPLFASPEQLLGQPIDTRSDIYSLSATLYYLLAGKAPFESPNAAQVIARIASSDPPPFASAEVEVLPELERIVMKGLAREPNKRYESMTQMRNELQCLVAPRPDVSSLRRRAIAWVADYFVVTAFISLVMILVLPTSNSTEEPQWLRLLSATLVFLYYFLSEAVFSTSLGKAAMCIEVCDAESNSKISVLQAATRALAFTLASSGMRLAIMLALPGLNPFVDSGLVLGSAVLQIAILLSTWWATNRRQLFHDWLSKTECRTNFGGRVQSTTKLSLPQWSVPLLATPPGDPRCPVALGRFQVHGIVDAYTEIPDSWWLHATDSQLQRTVWIACFGDRSFEYEQMQQVPKSRRFRYIDEGNEPTFRWFAYAAPESVPLHECVLHGVHFPWPVTRSILTSISEEARAYGRHARTLAENPEGEPVEAPSPWSSQRWWVDALGQLSWVDFAYRAPALPKPEQNPCTSWMGLVHTISMLGLPSKHRLRKGLRLGSAPIAPSNVDIEELPPLRAAKLLEKISAKRVATNPRELEESLAKTDQGPHRVTGRSRFIHAAVSLGLMVPWLCLGIVMLSIPALILCFEQSKKISRLKTVRAAVDAPVEYADFWALAPERSKEQWMHPMAQRRIHELLIQEQSKMEKMLKRIGTLEQFILSKSQDDADSLIDPPGIGPKHASALPGESAPTVSSEETAKDNGVDTPKMRNKPSSESIEIRGTWSHLLIRNAADSDEEEWSKNWTQGSVASVLSSIEQPDNFAKEAGEFPDGESFLWGILACIIWTTLTLGGITQYFTGSCVVRRDGCRLNMWRSLWRASILFLPLLGVGLLAAYGNSQGTDWIWATTQLKRAFILLPFVYLASTIRWSQPTLLDKLAGTAVIPR
ncbi:MAG: protein kinase domain-containing protein [Pirellula sp.]